MTNPASRLQKNLLHLVPPDAIAVKAALMIAQLRLNRTNRFDATIYVVKAVVSSFFNSGIYLAQGTYHFTAAIFTFNLPEGFECLGFGIQNATLSLIFTGMGVICIALGVFFPRTVFPWMFCQIPPDNYQQNSSQNLRQQLNQVYQALTAKQTELEKAQKEIEEIREQIPSEEQKQAIKAQQKKLERALQTIQGLRTQVSSEQAKRKYSQLLDERQRQVLLQEQQLGLREKEVDQKALETRNLLHEYERTARALNEKIEKEKKELERRVQELEEREQRLAEREKALTEKNNSKDESTINATDQNDSFDNGLSVASFEFMSIEKDSIPVKFRSYVEKHCPGISAEAAYALYQEGQKVKNGIYSGELKTFSSEEEMREKVISLVWFFMCSKAPFKNGSLILEDPGHKLANVLLNCPGVTQRISSHKVGGEPQYGLDLNPSVTQTLPANKSTLLLEKYYKNGKPYLFIKPEDHGLNSVSAFAQHSIDYLIINALRKMSTIYKPLNPDEGEGIRKERLPKELEETFNQIQLALGQPFQLYASKKAVSAMIADLAVWLESDIKPEQFEQAKKSIGKFIQFIRDRGWDHLDDRIGNEVIFGVNSILELDKKPEPDYLGYLEALVKIRETTNVDTLIEALKAPILKSTPWIQRDAFIQIASFQSKEALLRQVQRDFPNILRHPLFTLNGQPVAELIKADIQKVSIGDSDFQLIKRHALNSTTDEDIQPTVAFIQLLRQSLPQTDEKVIDTFLCCVQQNARNALMSYLNSVLCNKLNNEDINIFLLTQTDGENPYRVMIQTTPTHQVEVSQRFNLRNSEMKVISTLEGRVKITFDKQFNPFVEWSWSVLS